MKLNFIVTFTNNEGKMLSWADQVNDNENLWHYFDSKYLGNKIQSVHYVSSKKKAEETEPVVVENNEKKEE